MQKIHSPNLSTVIMVEEFLKDNQDTPMKVSEIKEKLPRKVMHRTLLQILDYLQLSGKIIIGTKGILWIFTERKELDKLRGEGLEI